LNKVEVVGREAGKGKTNKSRCEKIDARLASPAVLRRLLQKSDISPRRGLGQNFLIDGNILRKIVATVEPVPGDLILEIGAGVGTLTRALASGGAHVIAVEIDSGLVQVLKQTVGKCDNVWIVHEDILAGHMDDLLISAYGHYAHGGSGYGKNHGVVLGAKTQELTSDGGLCDKNHGVGPSIHEFPGLSSLKIASNLPFYITSPFCYEVFKSAQKWQAMTLLVQEEAAKRIIAGPGDPSYGALSVVTHCAWDARIVARVPPTAFWPVPDVDSSILHLTSRDNAIPYERRGLFLETVQAAFSSRRKTLLNSLFLHYGNRLSLSKEEIRTDLRRLQIDPGLRAQDLSIEVFNALSEVVLRWHKSHKRATL
jgi:16S rRNA (adenine1518-N6/adenine1519-N6)-dimethyltransferase